MGGFNNNPTSNQFSAAYKRLLHHNEVKSSAQGNCLELEHVNILTVSSRRKNKEKVDEEESTSNIDDINIDEIPLQYVDATANHAITYISGFVEKIVFQKLQCEECISIFSQLPKEDSSFIALKSRWFLTFPSQDTYKIICTAEKIYNVNRINTALRKEHILTHLIVQTMRNLDISNIFVQFEEHTKTCEIMENHIYFLIKLIIKMFLKIKSLLL